MILPPLRDRVVSYATGPLVGFEARVSLTDHVQFVPGVRIQSVSGGWLIRPGVGLGWAF